MYEASRLPIEARHHLRRRTLSLGSCATWQQRELTGTANIDAFIHSCKSWKTRDHNLCNRLYVEEFYLLARHTASGSTCVGTEVGSVVCMGTEVGSALCMSQNKAYKSGNVSVISRSASIDPPPPPLFLFGWLV